MYVGSLFLDNNILSVWREKEPIMTKLKVAMMIVREKKIWSAEASPLIPAVLDNVWLRWSDAKNFRDIFGVRNYEA